LTRTIESAHVAGISKILVDIDPDRIADEAPTLPAIDRAQQLATATGASIDLLLCPHVESMADGVLFDNESAARARDSYREELRQWLEVEAAKIRGCGTSVNCHVDSHSPRYEAILARARETGADLIVRGARKHTRLDRLFFTPTDWELIRRAPQLLWLVKKSMGPRANGLRVLAAVDPSHPEEKKAGLDAKLVSVAGRLVKLFGGAAHIFHAYRPGAMVAPIAAPSHQGALAALHLSGELAVELEKHRKLELRKLSEASGIPEDHVHLVAGSTTRALDELVEQLQIDVVVAGAVARGRLERLLLGSTAEAILDDVPCDVVVVKPDGFPGSGSTP
jgi:universal stress protein E